ncbi:MAG: hypothetical protein ACM3Q2_00400 [Syntrophothermus sp.]
MVNNSTRRKAFSPDLNFIDLIKITNDQKARQVNKNEEKTRICQS